MDDKALCQSRKDNNITSTTYTTLGTHDRSQSQE
jgi:hypothetical protein